MIMKKLLITIILLTICSTHAQTDEKETLKQLNQKVITSYRNQKFDEALKLAQQAVDLSLKIYGAEQPETAVAYTNLGVMYQDKKKYKESIENLQKAVEIYQEMSASKSKELIATHQILAYSQFLNGDTKESEANYLKSIEVVKSKFGRESKESFLPILNTANFYARTEEDEKARESYLKSYELAKKHFGEESSQFESVSIYVRVYSKSSISTDEIKKNEFKKRYAEIVGYEIGEATSLIRPTYPYLARTQGKRGRIVVKVWVDAEGNVTDAKTVYGDLVFHPEVEYAAKKSKFKPTIKNGKSVQVVNFVTYNF